MKPDQLATIRYLNREYTEVLGLLSKNVFDINLSWPESRILLTIKSENLKTVNEVSVFLNIDKSYTSRLINHLLKKGLIDKTPSDKDRRSNILTLTSEGKLLCQKLDTESDDQIEKLLGSLDSHQKQQFYDAIITINQLLFEGGQSHVAHRKV
ncbi:MarR family winged helix-turn-helix transcriptional regulator [Lentilactobacillus parakefiri]|uniref:HTH marR-type domain-containing protein n=1 Tax=Lentilactobacillus parakefiri TaxID=152332 RepID=A0A269Y2K5_9LACO|nr:MarR family transcriptional regulator [Lentilactobacillus parakefiri]PAK79774.1 hypothetical protein B8W98_09510 [Lentilactobacillus parakefiri]